MAGISLRLLGREARGLRPRLARILPSVEPTDHGDDVVVPELLERVGSHRGAHAAGAVEDGRLVFVGEPILGPLLEIALGDVHRTDDVTLVPLVLLADVTKLDLVRAQQLLHLLGGRFLDALLYVGEVVAITRHRLLSQPNPKPSGAVGNSSYARSASGDALLRPSPVPVSPRARGAGRWHARPRHGRGAGALRSAGLLLPRTPRSHAHPGRGALRRGARALRRLRDPRPRRARRHERAQIELRSRRSGQRSRARSSIARCSARSATPKPRSSAS